MARIVNLLGVVTVHWVAVLPRDMALHSRDSARSYDSVVGSDSTWEFDSVQGSDSA